ISLEKFMDFGFMESIRNYPSVPPIDPFLSGYGINYYYLGHWLATMRGAAISGYPIAVYHLKMSFILSQLFTGVFVIVRYCYKKLCLKDLDRNKPILNAPTSVAILSAIFISFGGNSHIF